MHYETQALILRKAKFTSIIMEWIKPDEALCCDTKTLMTLTFQAILHI
jgi:hypothetical protein